MIKISDDAGTTATDDHGTIVGKGDAGEQAKRTFLNIKKAMASLGADLATHTIRTRMFVVDLKRWASIIGLVHGSIFNHNNDQNDYDNNNNDDGECRGCCHPVSSMIGVSSLYDEDMLIEIEVEAFVPDRSVK